MTRPTVFKLLAAAYVVWGAWNWYIDRPVHPPAGILAPAEPFQAAAGSRATTRIGRWTLQPRATYRITARILHVERYRFDALASLVPEDLALGWGPMSDSRILDAMDISQSDRFYFWRASQQTLPISKEAVIAHSANTHVIPENAAVAAQLGRLRRGEVVTLGGVLVDARRDDGAWLNTSLVRTDTGAGACEVFLVRDVRREQ
jgi:hypothetical protein